MRGETLFVHSVLIICITSLYPPIQRDSKNVNFKGGNPEGIFKKRRGIQFEIVHLREKLRNIHGENNDQKQIDYRASPPLTETPHHT